MAEILEIGAAQLESSDTGANQSSFEQILAIVCDRIDTLRGSQPELDRRGIPRKKTALRAQCSGDWGASPCLISDLSEGGMAFVCGHLHGIGDLVSLDFSTPRGRNFRVEAIVRHVTGPYIGVEFQHLNWQQHRDIAASLTVVTLPARESEASSARRAAS